MIGTLVMVSALLTTQHSQPKQKDSHEIITVTATAYTSSPSENGGNTKTATGHPLRGNIIAVDPRIIPLGSTVHIKGLGVYRALDTGGAIKGRRIDILMSRGGMGRWGRRKVEVTILARGTPKKTYKRHKRKHK